MVHPLTDRPDWVYRQGFELTASANENSAEDLRRLVVGEVKPANKGLIVHFAGVRDRNEASRLKHLLLFAPLEALAPLEEGEFFHFELVGLEVVTRTGERVGRVEDLLDVGESKLLQVGTGSRPCLVPYRPEFVVEVDLDENRMVIAPPEGLLEV